MTDKDFDQFDDIDIDGLDDEFVDELLGIKPLLDILKKMPKERMTMVHPVRYAEAMKSVGKIVSFVKSDCPDANVNLYFDEITGTTLCLTIVADEFNIYKIEEFCKAIEPANTMSVIPHADGLVEIGFTYKGVQVPIPPK